MRICPKCMEVFGSSFDRFCRFDGTKTLDASSSEAQKLLKKKEVC